MFLGVETRNDGMCGGEEGFEYPANMEYQVRRAGMVVDEDSNSMVSGYIKNYTRDTAGMLVVGELVEDAGGKSLVGNA